VEKDITTNTDYRRQDKMNIQKSEFQDELEVAIEAAETAGKVIDDYAENGFQDGKKDDGSFVTEADVEAQKTVVSEIKKEFPEDGFLGEEEHLEPDGEERVWIIDPVDGTFNFRKNFGYHCVSIALQVEEETAVGVVHCPESSLDKTYLAAKNQGSHILKNEERLGEASSIETSDHEKIQDAVYFATMFDIYENELELEQEVVKRLAEKGGVHRQLGACAIEMCYVAEGKADLMYNPIAKKWDYAAAKLIIEEAGGTVRTQKSQFPNSYEIATTNGKIQEELEELLDNSK
jgi:myo-inositol-1(or 4)-monophosphatase